MWIPDNMRTNCVKCEVFFSFMVRKHHCRRCGDIFCSSCSQVYCGTRLCIQCKRNKTRNTKCKQLIILFSKIPIAIHELYFLLYCVSKKYNHTVNYLLVKIKRIQYMQSYMLYTGIQISLLQSNILSFAGHSRLMVHCFRCLHHVEDFPHLLRLLTGEKNTSCEKLFCEKTICHKHLNVMDLFDLVCSKHILVLLEHDVFFQYLGTMIRAIHDNWFCLLIPWVFNIGHTAAAHAFIETYLINRTTRNINIIYKLFFESRLLEHSRNEQYFRSLSLRIFNGQTKKVKEDIKKTENLLKTLELPNVTKQALVDTILPCRCPFDPKIIIANIYLERTKQLHTFTNPHVLIMDTNCGVKNILIKNEDVRADRLSLIFQYFLCHVHGDFAFTLYSVMPIHPRYGWIEMVADSKTLYEIKEKGTLSEYIFNTFSHLSVDEIRGRFIQTVASNCVMSYLLGLGDRNTMNILVNQQGDVIHIDYSFLLGRDPKFNALAKMSLRSDMVAVLGGTESEAFKKLTHQIHALYIHTRAYSFFWYSLMKYLDVCYVDTYTGIEIRNHIMERFMTTTPHADIKISLETVMSESTEPSLQETISDISHSLRTGLMGMFNY
jgi:hypothetical protein